jgi:hypothetical protein
VIELLAGLIAGVLAFAIDAARALTAEPLVLGSVVWLAGLLLVIVRPQH